MDKQRITEILDEEPSIKNSKNPLKEVKNGSIEFRNVAFSYIGKKNKEVLKNINIKIESGETVGIIGGTGVGKSSLVNALLNQDRVIVSNISGTTRDSIDTPFTKGDKQYVVIDTAGLKKKGKIYESIDK